MTITLNLITVLFATASIAFVIPFLIKPQGSDWMRGFNNFMWALACWPLAAGLVVWALVEMFR